MKQLLIAAALATSFATSSVMAAPVVAQGDMNQIFAQQAKPVQVVKLSGQEMGDTEGEFWVNAAGALAGAWGGGLSYYAANGFSNFNGQNAVISVLGGGAAGFFSPVRGFSSLGYAIGGGLAGGYTSSALTNYGSSSSGWWR